MAVIKQVIYMVIINEVEFLCISILHTDVYSLHVFKKTTQARRVGKGAHDLCSLPPPPLPPPPPATRSYAPLVWTWHCFFEATAEETPAYAMANEKPKGEVKTENDDPSHVKGAGQKGSVAQFKIKRHTPLSKLMEAYCEQQALSRSQTRFPFVWMPINETDTPAQLEMEAEDTNDVFQWKTRGFYQRGNLLLNSRILFLQTKKTFSVITLQFGSTTS